MWGEDEMKDDLISRKETEDGLTVLLDNVSEKLKDIIDNQSRSNIYEHLFHQIYTQYLDTYRMTVRERYINLLHRCPQIVQQINLKDIASFLRVTPTTISNIRRDITFES